MKKTRVPKGEKYWYIRYNYNTPYELWFVVDWGIEESDEIVNNRFDRGNYFHTKEEAEAMANKLRAVLKGADVIEMPSEEEIIFKVSDAVVGKGLTLIDDGEAFKTVYSVVEWLKSKIVK